MLTNKQYRVIETSMVVFNNKKDGYSKQMGIYIDGDTVGYPNLRGHITLEQAKQLHAELGEVLEEIKKGE